jgi:hypothetical protein
LSKVLLSAAVLLAWLAAPAAAQGPARVATTIDEALAQPLFFHGRQIAVLGAAAQDGSVSRFVRRGASDQAASPSPGKLPVFVFWREAPSHSEGEIRGEFWDLGRVRQDDPRLSRYDFRPLLEQVTGGRWPGQDEIFVIVGATAVDPPPSSAPTVRSIAMAPSTFGDRTVTVVGRFRGRNLYGDLPTPLNMSKWDFVLQSADAALWVTGLRPRGSGFELDPGAKVDTNRWIEVSGTVHAEGSRAWIAGESVKVAPPPDDAPDLPSAPAVVRQPPPSVIFTAPLADDTDVSPDTTLRLQFSSDMDTNTFAGRVRVTYVETRGAPGGAALQAPKTSATYRDGNRALEIKFAEPLQRFRTVKVELLEGIKALDGQPLAPWSMTFTTGAQ